LRPQDDQGNHQDQHELRERNPEHLPSDRSPAAGSRQRGIRGDLPKGYLGRFDMWFIALLFVLPVVLMYFAVIKGADRYEPEPLGLVMAMFFWGAVVATMTALVGNTVGHAAMSAALGAQSTDPLVQASTASFVAPVVEETTKGAGLLLLWLLSRLWLKELDGPLDGVIYGGVIGLGFTLTEDILYIQRAAEQAGAVGFGATFFMRTVLSGLGHATFTAATGLGIGIAVASRRAWVWVLAPLLGWCAAIGLHSLHNLLCTFLVGDGTGIVVKYLLFWCFDLLYFVLVVLLALRDRATVATQLRNEIGRLILPKEFARTTSAWMLLPFYNRLSLGGSRGGRGQARRKQLDLIELAFVKQRQNLGEHDQTLDRKERTLRARIAQANGRGIHIGAP
jgi:protease PrsW